MNKRRYEDSRKTASTPKTPKVHYKESEVVEDYEDINLIIEQDLNEEVGREQLNFLE